MNLIRNLSLSTKINLVVLVAVLLFTVMLSVIRRSSTEILLKDLGQFNIEQEINIMEQRLIEFQQELEASATSLVNTSSLVEAIIAGDQASLQSLYLSAAASLDIDDLDFVNVEEERVVDTAVDEDEDEEQEDVFVDQVLLGIQRTTVIIEGEGDERQVSLLTMRPLRDEQGEVIGGLIITRAINGDFLSELNFDRSGVELSLIYQDEMLTGTTIMAEHSMEQHSEFSTSLVANALEGTTVVDPELSYIDDRPHLQAYIPIKGLDDRTASAVMLVRIDTGIILDYEQALIRSSGAVLIIFGITVVMFIIISVRLLVTRRIGILQRATSIVAQGDYAKHVEIQGKDEISQLANSFNLMADEIRQRESELHQANELLEDRVKERTVELQEARDEAVEAKQIADENSRLKSEFLSMMSHELRTPMNAIEGFTGILLEGMGGVEFNAKSERYITKIQSNSRRLLSLINDFLDLSRIEAGRLEIANQPLYPKELAEIWRDNLSSLAQEKQIDFIVEVDHSLPETIYGDEESLSKIAINLLGNGIKFTEQGSVSLKLKKRDEKMVMEVKDTGVGIPPHALEFIFDEFRQVDMSSKRQHGGTGLGLSIVQKLARAMGGTVSVKSEVGTGSTFTVILPIHTTEKHTV